MIRKCTDDDISDAKPIADSNIYIRRTKLATLARLKVIRLYDFRHSCASLLINNSANVTLVVKFLGHTKIEGTQTYILICLVLPSIMLLVL